MATFVLVHGAFQGGWVWREVAAVLRGQGHVVHAPTLSGCAHLHHGAGEGLGLEAYIQDVAGFLSFEDLSDVVLAAHSFSGLVLGGVLARAARVVRRAVFVDALIPEKGRSFVDVAGEPFRNMLEAHRFDGWRIRPWDSRMFGVPASREEWFRARLRDFPAEAFMTPFPDAFDPAAVDAAFLTCRQTPAPFIQAMADKARGLGWPVSELDSAHCPMLTCPAELAERLAELAAPGASA